jgi:hypothetical protein
MDWGTILITGGVTILSGAVGGAIGAFSAVKVSRNDNTAANTRAQSDREAALALAREERTASRREKAYLEILLAVGQMADAMRDVTNGPRSLEFVQAARDKISDEQRQKARALAKFGSREVQRLYDDVATAAQQWGNAANDNERAQSWREAYAAIAAMESRVAAEMAG